MKEPKTIKLLYGDKFFAFGRQAIGQVILHFKTKHSIEEIRKAVRYMLTVYPRLRSIVVPSLFSYNCEILEDDSERLEALYNYAFRVVPKIRYNTKEYMEFKHTIFNEPFSLTTTIPIRFYFLPDSAVLIFTFNHAVGDGMSIIGMLYSLMSYLNGKMPPLEITYNPSFLAMFTSNPIKLPLYFFNSLWQMIKYPDTIFGKAKGKVLSLSGKEINFQGSFDIIHHAVPYNFDLIKSKSKEMGTTISVILVAALVMAARRTNEKNDADFLRIQIPIDIRHMFKQRPTYGNYAYVIIINVFRDFWDKPQKLIGEVNSQFIKMMDLVNGKKLLVPLLFMSLISKTISSKTYLRMFNYIMKNRPFNISLSFANLMNIDKLNGFGNKARLEEVYFTMTMNEPFFDFHTFNGKFFLTCAFQESAFNHEEIRKLIQNFEKSLGELLNIKIK